MQQLVDAIEASVRSVGKAALSKSLPANQIDRRADMYAVLDTQNEVITVGYRTSRIRRVN